MKYYEILLNRMKSYEILFVFNKYHSNTIDPLKSKLKCEKEQDKKFHSSRT